MFTVQARPTDCRPVSTNQASASTHHIFFICKFNLLTSEIKLEGVRLIFLVSFHAEKYLKFQSTKKKSRQRGIWMIQKQATEGFSVPKTTNAKTAHISDAHTTKIIITFLVTYNVSDLS